MSKLKTRIAAFLSRECSWMFSVFRVFSTFQKEVGGGISHLSLAYWCLPLGREGLMTAWKHFQMFPALNTLSRLPESLVWLHIDHWIVTNDSSGLDFFFFNACYELKSLEPDSCGTPFPLKTDSPWLWFEDCLVIWALDHNLLFCVCVFFIYCVLDWFIIWFVLKLFSVVETKGSRLAWSS